MMTSKEALEKLCKVKIYQKEASAYDYLGKEIYKEEIDTIKQDLERLEVLETSVLEYKDQEKLYWQTNENNVKLRQENEKLKKAIEILKDYTFIEFDDVDIYLKSSNCPLSYQEYELLKEVMNNENNSE